MEWNGMESTRVQWNVMESKGLEYDNVLIPFCDWGLEKTVGNKDFNSLSPSSTNKAYKNDFISNTLLS